MGKSPLLTAEEARKIWRYEPDTGEFFWRIAPPNGIRPIDSRAGTIGRDGSGKSRKVYTLRHNSHTYRAARVAWLIMTGEWPSHCIDHINGNPLDNRFANLRTATHQQNSYNQKKRPRRTNQPLTSHYKGVTQKQYSTQISWIAQIHINGQQLHLGSFKTEEEAHTAYCKAAKQLHGEFVRLK